MNCFSQGFVRSIPDSGAKGTIKSKQDGTVSLSTTSQSITINTVDITKSIIRISFLSGFTPDTLMVKGVITDKNTITISRITASGSSLVYWEVVEFYNVKSLQTGTLSKSGSSETTVSVSQVDKSKCQLYFSFTTTANTYDTVGVPAMVVRGRIVDSTNIAFYASLTTPTNSIAWQLIEFF